MAAEGWRCWRPVVVALAVLAAATPAATRPVVDATGRSVELPDRIDRILPAGPPAATLIYTLAPAKLLGWPHAPGADAKAYLLPGAAALPELAPLTSKGAVDKAAIAAARPDLIVDVGTVGPRYVDRAKQVQAETGVPTLLLDGSLDRTAAVYRLLGAAIGEAPRGEALAAAAERILAETRDAIAARPAALQRLRGYYGRSPDGLSTAVSSFVNVEDLKALGLANVAGDDGPPGFRKIDRAQLIDWNPEVVIAGDPAFARALRTDPALVKLAAVTQGRVLVPPRLPFGWTDEPPSVNRLLGLEWAGHALYPDIVRADPRQTVRDFYHLFYGVDLSDPQLDRLLASEQ